MTTISIEKFGPLKQKIKAPPLATRPLLLDVNYVTVVKCKILNSDKTPNVCVFYFLFFLALNTMVTCKIDKNTK